MKQLTIFFLFFFLLASTQVLAQREVIQRDSTWFFTDRNDCDSLVWFIGETVEARGGRKYTRTEPVGYNRERPCEGHIRARDTSVLVQAFANPLIIDWGRQQAQSALAVIYQPQAVRSITRLDQAFRRSRLPGLYTTVERMFADSLVGTYRFTRPATNGNPTTVNASIVKRQNGSLQLRVGTANTAINIFSDAMIELRDQPVTNQNSFLYRIPGTKQFTSIDGRVQLTPNDKSIIQGLGK